MAAPVLIFRRPPRRSGIERALEDVTAQALATNAALLEARGLLRDALDQLDAGDVAAQLRDRIAAFLFPSP